MGNSSESTSQVAFLCASTMEFRDPTKMTLVPFALAAVFAARGPVGADETKQTGEAPAAKKWRWKS